MQCPICLDDVCENAACLPCGHSFHAMCVLQAYVHNPQCPMCRGSKVDKPEASPPMTLSVDMTIPAAPRRARPAINSRQYRAYVRRRYRFEAKNVKAAGLKCRLAASRRRLAERQAEMKLHRRQLEAELERDSRLRALKHDVCRAKRSADRYQKLYSDHLLSHIGPPPELTVLRDERALVESMIRRAFTVAILESHPPPPSAELSAAP